MFFGKMFFVLILSATLCASSGCGGGGGTAAIPGTNTSPVITIPTIIPTTCSNGTPLPTPPLPYPTYAVATQIPTQIPTQQPAQTGSISGIVYDQMNKPLPGIEISLSVFDKSIFKTTYTDSLGKYVFSSLPVGSYLVNIKLNQPISTPVNVNSDSNIILNISGNITSISTPVPVPTFIPTIKTPTIPPPIPTAVIQAVAPVFSNIKVSQGNNLAIQIGKTIWVDITGSCNNKTLQRNDFHLGVVNEQVSPFSSPGMNNWLPKGDRIQMQDSSVSPGGKFRFSFPLIANPNYFKPGSCQIFKLKPVFDITGGWYEPQIEIYVTTFGTAIELTDGVELQGQVGKGFWHKYYYYTVAGKKYIITVTPINSQVKGFGNRTEDVAPTTYQSSTGSNGGVMAYEAAITGKSFICVQGLSEGISSYKVKVQVDNGSSSHANPLYVKFLVQLVPGANCNWSDTKACGQTSLVMVSKYHKQEEPVAEDIIAVNKYFGFSDWYNGDYTNCDMLVDAAKDLYGFNNSYSQSWFSIDDLKREINDGRPVIVAVIARYLSNRGYDWDGGHFVVAIGYTENEIICNDPGTYSGEKKYYSIPEFRQAMSGQNGSVVIIK